MKTATKILLVCLAALALARSSRAQCTGYPLTANLGLGLPTIGATSAWGTYNGQTEAVAIASMDSGTTNEVDWMNVSCHGWLGGATSAVGLQVHSSLTSIWGNHVWDSCGGIGIKINTGAYLHWEGGYIGDNLFDAVEFAGGTLWTRGVNIGAVPGTSGAGSNAGPCVMDLANAPSTANTWRDFGSLIGLNFLTGGSVGTLTNGICMNEGTLDLDGTQIITAIIP